MAVLCVLNCTRTGIYSHVYGSVCSPAREVSFIPGDQYGDPDCFIIMLTCIVLLK